MIVNIIITHMCNLRCRHCFFSDSLSQEYTHFDRDLWIELDHIFSSCGFSGINFTGGECTTNPDLPMFLKAAKEKYEEVSVFTNGVTIPDEVLELCDDYWVSLDGVGDVHNSIRGNMLAYQMTYRNLLRLRECEKNIHLQTTITKLNIEDITELLPIYGALIPALKSVSLEAVINKGNTAKNQIAIGCDELIRVRDFKSLVLEEFYYHLPVKDNLFYRYQIRDIVNCCDSTFPVWIDLVDRIAYVFSPEYSVPIEDLTARRIELLNEAVKEKLRTALEVIPENELINIEELI